MYCKHPPPLFFSPRVHHNHHGGVEAPDVTSRVRPDRYPSDFTHDRNVSRHLDALEVLQNGIELEQPNNRVVVTADVRYYRSILLSDSAMQRLRREEQMALADEVRASILFIQQHGYPRPRQYTSPPRVEMVHNESDPDDDGDADDMVGERRQRREYQGPREPPGVRVRRNDPQPQEYVVQEQHRRNAPFDRISACFTPSRRTNRATIRVNYSLDRRGQRVASLTIEEPFVAI